jgi:DNA polymerase I-like protein with 3'-5' exonuclease and polymerase domains
MLLQSAGAVIMKQATVNLYNKLTEHGLTHGKEWAFVAHIHDEYQVEVLPDYVDLVRDEAINGIKSTARALNFRCPLDGETHTGRTWAETH